MRLARAVQLDTVAEGCWVPSTTPHEPRDIVRVCRYLQRTRHWLGYLDIPSSLVYEHWAAQTAMQWLLTHHQTPKTFSTLRSFLDSYTAENLREQSKLSVTKSTSRETLIDMILNTPETLLRFADEANTYLGAIPKDQWAKSYVVQVPDTSLWMHMSGGSDDMANQWWLLTRGNSKLSWPSGQSPQSKTPERSLVIDLAENDATLIAQIERLNALGASSDLHDTAEFQLDPCSRQATLKTAEPLHYSPMNMETLTTEMGCARKGSLFETIREGWRVKATPLFPNELILISPNECRIGRGVTQAEFESCALHLAPETVEEQGCWGAFIVCRCTPHVSENGLTAIWQHFLEKAKTFYVTRLPEYRVVPVDSVVTAQAKASGYSWSLLREMPAGGVA